MAFFKNASPFQELSIKFKTLPQTPKDKIISPPPYRDLQTWSVGLQAAPAVSAPFPPNSPGLKFHLGTEINHRTSRLQGQCELISGYTVGSGLSASNVSPKLILPTALGGGCYPPHFTDGKTKAQRHGVVCLRSLACAG